MDKPSAGSFYQTVYEIVARIPAGRVVTYGDLAAWAGRPAAARQAGYAMHRCPSHLPWHRVVNARGQSSLGRDTTAGLAQRRRLADEGVAFVGGRIDMARYRWHGRDNGGPTASQARPDAV